MINCRGINMGCVGRKNHKWGKTFRDGIYRSRKCERCGKVQNLDSSRTARVGAVLYGLDEITSIFDKIDEENFEPLTEADVNFIEETHDACVSELTSLQEELEEWSSGMEGTGLEQTSKYESLVEASEVLGNSVSQLEDLDFKNLNSFEEVSDVLDIIENVSGELESVEIPGMYG